MTNLFQTKHKLIGMLPFFCHALQIYRSGKAKKDQEQEDEAPAPMTTRLRKQAERQREKPKEKETEEREPEGQITETISISDEGEEDRGPSYWGVEQVFSYINSLPGNIIFLAADFQHHKMLLNLTHKYGAEKIKHKYFNTKTHFQLFLGGSYEQ